MKELSIEEKAKAYDNVREKIAIRFGSNVAKEIFSEYEESEDEKIRKEIRVYFSMLLYDDNVECPKQESLERWIAWLGNIPYVIDHEKREGFRLGYKAGLEKQGEPKPALAKVGEDGSMDKSWHPEKQGEQKPVEWKQENVEELTDFENAMMHIGNSFFSANAGLDPNDTETVRSQANLLLELAQNQEEWSEEDNMFLQACIRNIEQQNPLPTSIYSDCIKWLKSLKGKYVPQHTKSEWNDEDEKYFNILISLINNPSSDGIFDYHQINKSAFNNWVKSLKDRYTWKPTMEQLAFFKGILDYHGSNFSSEGLRVMKEILAQLKAL